MENKNNETFSYSYSASDHAEIKRIREKYAPKEEQEDKMARLRRLDASVVQKGAVWSLVVGVVSALVLGVGMCCCMVWGGELFIPGIIIGVLGIAGVSLAYPVYTYVTKKEREKIAPEIIRLTDELLK